MSAILEAQELVTPARKLEFLRNPGSYGQQLAEVEIIETHMSWVFLAGNLVFKAKEANTIRVSRLCLSWRAGIRLPRRSQAERAAGA
jgi:hypothetical protein